jgi:hypothetical protein
MNHREKVKGPKAKGKSGQSAAVIFAFLLFASYFILSVCSVTHRKARTFTLLAGKGV